MCRAGRTRAAQERFRRCELTVEAFTGTPSASFVVKEVVSRYLNSRRRAIRRLAGAGYRSPPRFYVASDARVNASGFSVKARAPSLARGVRLACVFEVFDAQSQLVAVPVRDATVRLDPKPGREVAAEQRVV